MKRTIFAALMTAILVLPASARIGNQAGPARDVIVTMQDVSITADRHNADRGVITVQNPTINYKIQKGKEVAKPLTAAGFANLWSPTSQSKDSFAKVAPNAQLSFWDPAHKNFYEAKFSIEKVTIPEEGKLQLAVRFLDRQHPIQVTGRQATTKNAKATTTGQIHPTALSVGQIEQQLHNTKTSAVMVIDNSPWDPRKR
ncbi:MAG: hypothetical protein ABFQ95_07440 [Pseudomonadota bacterium]